MNPNSNLQLHKKTFEGELHFCIWITYSFISSVEKSKRLAKFYILYNIKMVRKSPSASATLYSVGTTKKGNDGNMWTVITTKNNIKRWKLTQKSSRKSPSASATLYPVGTTKKGNDGNMWIVIKTKNNIQRWKLIQKNTKKNTNTPTNSRSSAAAANKLYNNRAIYNKLSKFWAEKSELSDIKKSSEKWSRILEKVADELIDEGVLLFIYPMGYYFADYAQKDLEDYIQKNKAILKYYSKFGTDLDPSVDFFFDELQKVSFIFYLAVPSDSSSINLNHNIVNKNQVALVHKIFKKHFGNNFIWNKSNKVSMELVLPGKPRDSKRKSFPEMLIDKLKKDTKNKSYKFIKKGKISDKEEEQISVIQFTINPKIIISLLLKYGFERSENRLVMFDDFFIDEDKKLLYINLADDIGAQVYDNIRI
jgi:hypothetical protein